jgi:hypothetical protein
MEAMIKACQEQMGAETKTGLEEMKTIESEARAEHYEGIPHAEAMHLLCALQDWASDYCV